MINPRLAMAIPVLLSSITLCAVEPLSIDECLDYGLQNSPELNQARLNLTNSLLSVTIEKAAFDPTISGSTEESQDNNGSTSSLSYDQSIPWGLDFSAGVTSSSRDNTRDEEIDTTRTSVSLSKRILGDGGWLKSRQGIRDSLSNAAIQGNRVSLETRRLIFQIKQDYYSLIRSLQTLSIQQRRLERSKQNLERAILREDPLDIANAKIQVPEDEISIIRAEQSIANAIETIKLRMGMPVGSPTRISDAFSYVPKDIDIDIAIGNAMQNHESILNAYLEQDKRKRDARIQQWDRFPVVEVGVRYLDVDQDAGDDETDTRLEASITWPLGARADRANYLQALNRVEDQNLEIYNQEQLREQRVRNLGRLLNQAITAVKLQEERVTVGDRRLELFSDRWENGEIDILELIRSQNDLEDDKVQLVNLKTTYMDLLAEFEFEAALK